MLQMKEEVMNDAGPFTMAKIDNPMEEKKEVRLRMEDTESDESIIQVEDDKSEYK